MGFRQSTLENLAMNPDFWRDKTVFMTGHTGFKGSWLSLWLQSLGAHVVGYALAPPTEPNLFNLAKVSDQMVSLLGDIRDLDQMVAAVNQHQPDIVIHMAAQPLVRYSYAHPVETYATNVMGTVHVLEAVRQTRSVKVAINITTDKCYENREWVWGYRESDPMGGYDPYSSSKGCSELVTAAYRSAYFNPSDFSRHGLALASARAGNVIGGGDWGVDRLVPDIMHALLHGNTVAIRNPDATRPWQHVLEPLSGYLLLAQRLWEDGPAYAEGWNFGPNDEDARPVAWIADYLTRQWGANAAWQTAGEAHAQPHEAHYLKLDCSKARAKLQWRPRWQLEDALSRIVDWYRGYQRQADMRQICIAQIDDFMAAHVK